MMHSLDWRRAAAGGLAPAENLTKILEGVSARRALFTSDGLIRCIRTMHSTRSDVVAGCTAMDSRVRVGVMASVFGTGG